MKPPPDILSVRLRNRAQLLRMLASAEWTISRKEMRAEMRSFADELERDAEKAMALESKYGGSV